MLSFALFAATAIVAQPWTYDFGTTDAAITTNSTSTTFFPNTPAGGGTYRAQVQDGGGSIALVSPGTTLGSGAEVQLTASSTTKTNKFGVYSWSDPKRTMLLGFKLRTTATGDGTLAFNLGNSISANSANNISGVQGQSHVLVRFDYTGGELSVQRREGSTWVDMPGVFAKDTDHDVMVVANANDHPVSYYYYGQDRELSAGAYDLYVDGVRVSPAGGWPRAGTYNSALSGFSFFGESSPGNNAQLMVDDLWYTPELLGGPNVIYHHDFGTTAGTPPHPYATAPPTIDPLLTNLGWTNSSGAWGSSIAGVGGGQSLGRYVGVGTHTYSLALNVANGYDLRIDDISFYWKRGTASGVQNWGLTIEGVTVANGALESNDWEWTGLGLLPQPVLVTDGQVNLVLTLTGATNNVAFHIDEFKIYGAVVDQGLPLLGTSAFGLDLIGPTVTGTNSATQSFQITGSNLDPASGNLLVQSPGQGFEVSANGVTWGTSVQLAYSDGAIDAPIHVRHAAANPGLYSGTIMLSGGGASPVGVQVSAQTVRYMPEVIYLHNFGTATISGSPYTVSPLATPVPGILADGLTGSALANSTNSWGHDGGREGGNDKSIRMLPGTTDRTVTLSVPVAEGMEVEVSAFSFWAYRAGGTNDWSVTVEGVPVYSGGTVGTGWTRYGPIHIPPVLVTDGQIDLVIHLTNGTSNAGLSFDDLTLIGHSTATPTGGEDEIVYYSQMSGAVTDAIWDVVPQGVPGPAVFTNITQVVVQNGHTVTWDDPVAVGQLEVQPGGTLHVASTGDVLLYGSLRVDGQFTSAPGGMLSLVGPGPVSLQSLSTLEVWDLTVDTEQGAYADADLAVHGTLQLTNGGFTPWGTVTLVSDANGTGRLGPVGANAEYNGLLTVQRWIPGGATNWRLLGSPVAGRTIADWMDNFYTAGFPGSHWPEFYDTWHGGWLPGAQLWPSIRHYVEDMQVTEASEGLVGVESVQTALPAGKGFAAWCGDSLGGTQPFTVDVTGTPHVAKTPMALPVSWTPQVPSVPEAQGWNLLSNPLPSPIAFSAMSRGADLANGYYVYDPATGNVAYWDAELGMSFPAQALNGTIQSSQGFWVKAHGPAATLTVDESAKVNDALGGLFGGDELPLLGRIHLRLTHAANSLSDETVVVLGMGSPAVETGDALKLYVGHDQAPRIAVRGPGGIDLQVDRHGAITSDAAVPVVIRAAYTGLHTITVHAVQPGLTCLVLEDLATGVMIPVYDGSTYTFQQDNTDGETVQRFLLHATAEIPLTVAPGACGPYSGSATLEVGPDPVHLTLIGPDGVPAQVVPAASGTVVLDGLDTGIYTVVAATSSACGDLVHSFSVVASGEPVDLAVAGPDQLGVGETAVFDASALPGSSITWDMGDGTIISGPTAVHSYPVAGFYTVTTQGQRDACIETQTRTVQVGFPTGIATTDAPSTHAWHDGHGIVLDHAFDHGGVLTIELLDATGRLHHTTTAAARRGVVRLPAEVGSGVWLLRLTTAGITHVLRVPVVR